MRQVALLLAAGLCFIAAVLSLPLPLPLGFIFTVIGLSLLLLANPAMQRRFQAMRLRYPVFDRRLQSVEGYLPDFVRRALNGSEPRKPAG